MDNQVILHSPMDGVIIPIEKVPDPAFAEKMIGDGFSIDPVEGILRAPCDGTVIHIHNSLHAVTIQTDNGLEILLHIGIDTVELKGDGFNAETKEGAKVKTGDQLISFDMATVANNAPNLLTQVLISTMESVEKLDIIEPQEVKAGDKVCTVFCKVEEEAAVESEDSSESVETEIIIPNPLGLHARPAAVLANFAKTFSEKIELLAENGAVSNAKSVTSIMKLNTKMGDKISVRVSGTDADKTLSEIIKKIASGLGEDVKRVDTVKHSQDKKTETAVIENDELKGVPASSGIALGTAFILKEPAFSYQEDEENSENEQTRLKNALAQAEKELKELQSSFTKESPEKADIFAAHIEIISDPEIQEAAEAAIEKKKSAEFAWNSVCTSQAEELAATGNELLAARAIDLHDVSQRVLGVLQNIDISPDIPEGSIIITEELTPSMTAELDPEKIMGFCTVTGGATSHVAILAKALGIPAVVGVPPAIMSVKPGTTVVIDGQKGTLKVNIDDDSAARFAELQKQERAAKAAALASAEEPATTKDGLNIEIAGNIGHPAEAAKMVENGGEGIGLLRSEFIFVNRVTAPTEDEQFEAYRSVLENVKEGNRVIIRTLDVGGDKPLAYMPLPKEENPFLGERGIRVSLKYPEIFRTQLRALLRASEFGKLQIMFPMISGIDEWRTAKNILEEERSKLGTDPVPTGVMIEVPSAALMSDLLAEEVDFFSIGTNDLTQYTVAIDRGHSSLASQADALDPAVLKLIKMTVDSAKNAGKWVGVCGALGEDPQAAAILIGLGVDELSVSIPMIPTVKAAIRALEQKECAKIAEKAIKAGTAREVRRLV